jgi:DNA-binding LacI/PurR family transcriptional regulator
MTLQQVAEAAGVSASTVSRVINASPGIAASTVDAVHRAMEAMAFKPTRRATHRLAGRASFAAVRGKRVGFFILRRNTGVTPAYELLARGVSNVAHRLAMNLQVGFFDSAEEILWRDRTASFDGLILHGICSPNDDTTRLRRIPTVWLLGNAIRPAWGDQVMPDNGLIGQFAAQYLLDRGARSAIYCGLNTGWSLPVRAASFQNTIEEAGGTVAVLNDRPAPGADGGDTMVEPLMRGLAQILRAPRAGRLGIFVGEDWMMRYAYTTLQAHGLRPMVDVPIIGCNNDRMHFAGLSSEPATIDIRFERIASRGVEQLASRMQTGTFDDRLRIMVEPALVAPGPA